MNKEFKPTGAGNEILIVSENCFVSFNPHIARMGLAWKADINSYETAIAINGKFKILNGDFRKECLNKSEKELLELFEKNKDKND